MKKTLLSMLLLLLFVAGARAQNNIPLTFEAIAAGTVTLEKVGDFTPNSEVQYRLGETGNWSSYSYGTGISLQAGQKLQFCSTSSVAYAIDLTHYSHFTCTADCYLYGNLGSLFYYGNSVPNSGCERMFYGNTHIKNLTGNSLVLPATSLGGNCYRAMFSGCTALTAAPALPATSLEGYCYEAMFFGCTALTTAPALPATSLASYCYCRMFSGCSALTTAPALPATSLATYCYREMFYGCTALTAAPALPATSLADYCYYEMFSGCTHLSYVSCLAMDISADHCTSRWLYEVAATGTFVKAPGMENWTTGDSGIPFDWTVEDYYDPTMGPLTFEAIAAGTVTLEKVGDFTPNSEVQYRLGETGVWSSYSYGTGISLQAGQKLQFRSTSSVAYAIDPSHYSHFTCTADCYLYGSVGALFNYQNSLPKNACSRLLYGNTHVLNHPDVSLVLPATSLAQACYEEMFSGCTALTTAPALPATSLARSCYQKMFSGCTALTAAPELPATSLVDYCYYAMFSGCTHLIYVSCLAMDISANDCTYHWLSGVAATGTFEKAPGMEHWTTGDSGIPVGWTVEGHDPITTPLTFRAVEAGTITVKLDVGSTLNPIEYSLNGSVWTYVGWGIPIDLAADDVICFRGNNGTCCDYVPINEIWAGFHFECSNPCYVYGNMMSLIDKNNFATNTTLTETFAFYSLFYTDEPNTTILNHPSLDIVLPATTLTANCYDGLFMNCQGITRAPTLPATTLAEGCYSSMFYKCTNLITAPSLPATTLANDCYSSMFRECIKLTAAPVLPATTLAESCYYGMFNGCRKLATAPVLPVTELYSSCYRDMFKGCKSLTIAPALPATTLAEHCYDGMFNSCTNLTTAPALPATTLVNNCYQNMFYGCSKLNYVVCLATYISANNCLRRWLQDVASSGTFVKDPDMGGWTPNSSDGIPSGWTVNTMDNVFTTDGNWNVPGNWSNNAVPTAGSSVVIAAHATIPSGYTANVKCIIINEGKTLTIADGGQFIHDNAGVVATVQKNIAAYTSANDGWNFIASPVTENLVSAQVSGLIPSGATIYDLYYLDEENTKWVNYKAHEGNADPGFDIVHNKGYLYANSGGTTINFSGPLQPYVAAGITVNLAKEGDGWNLVGNPFAFNAYANKSYYVINGRSVEPVSLYSSSPIAPCTGIVVQATGDNETVKFTKDNPNANSNQGNLNIVVAEQMTTRDGAPTGSATVDKAIVSFNEGSRLEKFVFNESKAKLYIPQGQEEFAIATSGGSGEMPVNFHANENGTYTLTVNPENVEMGYLHLIDNMTGADIDLLTTPTYTFNAKTTDYASRFRLVFVARSVFGDEDSDDEHFAFISNGNIIINGEGTVQLIDMAGHILVSVDGHTRCIPTAGMTSGVYVLRLIDGNDVKSQKIVVR